MHTRKGYIELEGINCIHDRLNVSVFYPWLHALASGASEIDFSALFEAWQSSRLINI